MAYANPPNRCLSLGSVSTVTREPKPPDTRFTNNLPLRRPASIHRGGALAAIRKSRASVPPQQFSIARTRTFDAVVAEISSDFRAKTEKKPFARIEKRNTISEDQ